MRWLDKLLCGGNLGFGARRVDQELDEELRFHLEQAGGRESRGRNERGRGAVSSATSDRGNGTDQRALSGYAKA